MGNRLSVSRLPAKVRAALDKRFRANWYGDFDGTAAWLREQGHSMSRSALHRYATALKNHDLMTGRADTLLADRASGGYSKVRRAEASLLQELGQLRRRELEILDILAVIEETGNRGTASSDSA